MKYTLHTIYLDDFTHEMMEKVERTNDLSSALAAASIYIIDPDCVICNIYDNENNKRVLCYQK